MELHTKHGHVLCRVNIIQIILSKQLLALKKMEPDFWIELESTYRERIAQRKALYAAHGFKVMKAQPGTESASRSVSIISLMSFCISLAAF